MKKIKKVRRIAIIILLAIIFVSLGLFYKQELASGKNQKDKNSSTEILNEQSKEASNKNTSNENNSIKKQVLLVNRENPIGSDYKPNNLVNVNKNGSGEILMEKEAATKFQEMINAAKKDGINIIPVSAYRSYKYQKEIFDHSVKETGLESTKKYVATPGQSEHQTGLSVDVGTPGAMDLTEKFEKTNAYKWLNENMDKYGFIIRYPKGKEKITGYNYEPWHLRYVGVDVAKDIHNKGLTLEEYLNKN